MESLVSVIIPVHNAEAYLAETVASCLQQSYNKLEIIMVENGSSDESWKLINTFKDSRIQVFKLEEGNAAAARNFGYKQSKGRYIKFLDADDILSPSHIEEQVKVLEQNPLMLASAAWIKFIRDKTENSIQPQTVWNIKDPIDWLVTAWNGGGMMVPGCWLTPRTIIEKAGLWNTVLSLHDDGEFMCRVLLASRGIIFNKSAKLYYRQSESSLSKNNSSFKAAKSALSVYKSYQEQIFLHRDSVLIRRALARNYARFIYEFYPSHEKLLNEARELLSSLKVKIP